MKTHTSENLSRSRAEAFRALHQQSGIFVVANPWDAGSAKVLAALGFKALATTSAGLAFSLGKPDGHASITREETLWNVQSILMPPHCRYLRIWKTDMAMTRLPVQKQFCWPPKPGWQVGPLKTLPEDRKIPSIRLN